MPLTLITGPANAAKAGWVLGAFREALGRAASARLPAPEPLLVVPTSADVEPYQRELVAGGTVFGGDVLTFDRLLRLIAQRTGYRARRIGAVARARVVRAVAAEARLDVLAASAASPGFAAATADLFAELQRAMVTPERFLAAVRQWDGGRRAAAAAEVGRLYAAYRRRLDRLGRVDGEGWAWGALDALRADPARWDGRPVFLYGFDDLTPAQLDAVETLVRACAADVALSLTYEPGRAAFAARAAAVETLRPLAQASGRVVELPEVAEHYAPAARPALHHLERRLFEGGGERVPPNGAVRLLEAGGERAEAELIGAALLELVRQGAAPGELAVLTRSGDEAPLLEQVLEAYGLPVERAARVPLARTRLGAGLLAYGRAALPGAAARDLLLWLRTPGKLATPEGADAFEAQLRRNEVATAAQARRLWPAPLPALDALAGAAAEGAAAFLDVLEAELDAIWTSAHERRAHVLAGHDGSDARVAAQVRAAIAELRGLARDDPALVGGAADVLEALADVEVRLGAPAGAGVLLADPLAVRARRFRGVVVCGLQDGAFPRHPAPEPFLDDADRRALAQASGVALPLHEDVLARERFLFYSAVSRAEEVLFVSFRSSDEEGEPELRSPFVDDVRDLFTDELWAQRGRRLLAEVTWPPAQAPTPLELRRAQAAAAGAGRGEPPPLAAPRSPAVLAGLAERRAEAARGLEAFDACGVRWLVESLLRPQRIEPDPEPMQRGSLAHAVLERTLRGLRERTGSARLTPAARPEAERELRTALGELRGTRAGVRARAALRALEVDLLRWLDQECAQDDGFEPLHLEWSFGGEQDDGPALEVGGVRLSGRIDRIDVGPGGAAIVRDYKNSTGYPRAAWAEDGHLQAALYALAARELLGLAPVGALYQPLRGRDLRPRGAVVADAAAAPVETDSVDAAEWEALLDELRGRAADAAARLRRGEIRACPERCTPRGCGYPGICRARELAPPEAAA
ncbi:MAG TPA: PD-(D/E)XK nuclease family protein [Solirubrobacteraceae bacterium]|nr:PD-(D/E)XK nuclease family protein [Solirubrobacteraceae bacterium]